MANLLRTPTSYLQIRQPGDLLNRVRSSEAVSNFIGVDEVTLVASLLNLCLMILVLAVSSPTLSILLLIFQIIGFGFVLICGWHAMVAKRIPVERQTVRVRVDVDGREAAVTGDMGGRLG